MSRRRERRLTGISGRDVDRIMENLRRKGDGIVRAAKQALSEGAEMIVEDAKSRVPVKTGKLKNSIHATAEADGAVFKIEATARNADGLPYAQFVEYDPRINQPFLYPAVHANISALNEKLKTAMGESLRH